MASKNLMSDQDDDGGRSHRPAASSTWSIASMLGLDRCCATASFSGAEDATIETERLTTTTTETTTTRAESSSDRRKAASPAKSSGGFMSGLMGKVTVAFGGQTPEDKRLAGVEKNISLIKEGSIFTRRVKPGEKNGGAVWLQLSIDKDECGAQIEWRSPQLVLNRAVNQESIPLDACECVRKASAADAAFFPNGGPSAAQSGLCFVVIGSGKTAVFEAHSPQVCEEWVAALGEARTELVQRLDVNRQAKLRDERRQKEIEERKSTRDARRAEYAKAGMSNTARIMAMGTGRS
mmetsp:Transcript_28702/g.58737  ORF Transcript_28702/g.58737 Transcript_28702/m.58737 type:complete len:293 (-) Transcript_28702:8-886(-)